MEQGVKGGKGRRKKGQESKKGRKKGRTGGCNKEILRAAHHSLAEGFCFRC
jgi:hypothetical protein